MYAKIENNSLLEKIIMGDGFGEIKILIFFHIEHWLLGLFSIEHSDNLCS